MSLRIASLCSGVGMLDLAVMDALGGHVVWHAQYDPEDKHQYAARILAHRFPGVPNHGDITAIDYATVEPVDVLTAGWPCQDMSLAGLGAGLMPGTRSGLWYHVARAIAALRPPIVILENVRSLTSARAHSDVELCPWCMGDLGDGPAMRALGTVLGDLADLGFDAEWLCLPASDVGAPHQRWRAFALAWPADAPCPRLEAWREGRPRGGATADADEVGRERGRQSRRGGIGPQDHDQRADVDWGPYTAAVRRWERLTDRPAPTPTEPGKNGPRLWPSLPEWMMGLPAGWVTDVPGIPRNAQLHALGNGVVRQQGAAAIRILDGRRRRAVSPAPAVTS